MLPDACSPLLDVIFHWWKASWFSVWWHGAAHQKEVIGTLCNVVALLCEQLSHLLYAALQLLRVLVNLEQYAVVF